MKIILLILLIFLFNTGFAELKFFSDFPFKIGEKLICSISVLGVYIGDQEIFIEDLTNIDGQQVIVGYGRLSTTPFISSLYKVDDRERTYFLPKGFVPIYYERWINEGSWHDNIKFHFYPDSNKVDIAQKVNNYENRPITYSNVLRNYFTLIVALRAVDYDYHIYHSLNVEIDYLFGTSLKKAIFKPTYKRILMNGEEISSIYLQEIGGIGINFYFKNDAERTPIRLVIPAFEVIGFKTISVYVELKEKISGTREIPPLKTN
jgi:hypothetical protein